MIHDDTLVSDCLHGDEGAFRVLAERHRERLYRLACGILHDSDLASDAVQEAFLRAYSALAEYRGRGVFGAWMRRILVNYCLSQLRQRHNYLSLEELDRDLAACERGPEEQYLAHSDTERLRRTMGRLPAHYRTALVLRAVEGLSYREIAHLLGVSESTVETWIHRGRLRMRALLQSPPLPAAGSLLRTPAGEVASGEFRHDLC